MSSAVQTTNTSAPPSPAKPKKVEVGSITLNGRHYTVQAIFRNSRGDALEIPEHFENAQTLNKLFKISEKIQDIVDANASKAMTIKKLTKKDIEVEGSQGKKHLTYKKLNPPNSSYYPHLQDQNDSNMINTYDIFKHIENDLLSAYKKNPFDEVIIGTRIQPCLEEDDLSLTPNSTFIKNMFDKAAHHIKFDPNAFYYNPNVFDSTVSNEKISTDRKWWIKYVERKIESDPQFKANFEKYKDNPYDTFSKCFMPLYIKSINDGIIVEKKEFRKKRIQHLIRNMNSFNPNGFNTKNNKKTDENWWIQQIEKKAPSNFRKMSKDYTLKIQNVIEQIRSEEQLTPIN